MAPVIRWASIAGLALSALVACGSDPSSSPAAPPPESSSPPAPAPEPEPPSPTASLAGREPTSPAASERGNEPPSPTASPTASPTVSPAGSERTSPAAPEPGDEPSGAPAGCTFGSPIPFEGSLSSADVASVREGFLVAYLRMQRRGEELAVASVAPGARPTPSARAPLAAAASAAARRGQLTLAVDGDRAAVALSDGRRQLLFAPFPSVSPVRVNLVPVGVRASLRFAPALFSVPNGWMLVWTDASATPMRVLARRLDAAGGAVGAVQDLTPVAGGAAAPAPVIGAVPPRLVFLDPRQGTSVALRSDLGDSGFSAVAGASVEGASSVARSIGLVTEAPQLVAIRLASHDHLAFTGIGSLARTAIGLVDLDTTLPASPLVPAAGYGRLEVDVDRWGSGAVFAATAPLGARPDSPREVQIIVVDVDGHEVGARVVLRGPGGSASRGRIAVSSTGAALVIFRDGERGFAVHGRCGMR